MLDTEISNVYSEPISETGINERQICEGLFTGYYRSRHAFPRILFCFAIITRASCNRYQIDDRKADRGSSLLFDSPVSLAELPLAHTIDDSLP